MIAIKSIQHRNRHCYAVIFKYDAQLTNAIKSTIAVSWSNTHKCWYFEANEKNLRRLIHTLKNTYGHEVICEGEIQQKIKRDAGIHSHLIDQLKAWMHSRRYSKSTIQSYTEALQLFFTHNSEKNPVEITPHDITRFNNEYILHKGLSHAYQNQFVNALKLFYSKVVRTSINVDVIERPKRQKKLPNVLSKEEVKLILTSLINLKHRALLSLVYSCGLRCGEVLRLKPEHVDSKRNLLIIKQAKGRKDRVAPLSDKTIELLREYYKLYRPKEYLFEGVKPGTMYDERSLQQVLKNAVHKCGIRKPVSLHWLRHSYATHLLENGTDLRYIQEILGHSSSKTTEIYTHVSAKSIQKISSPFDSL